MHKAFFLLRKCILFYKITKVDPCGFWCYFRCPPSLNLRFLVKYFSVIGTVEMSGVTYFIPLLSFVTQGHNKTGILELILIVSL